ncbi:hypothetical protein JX265_007043 [Neoarthrinium moseri]|uniref:Midasin n=1 Tax=Neoarthrinium moseri TaxID=1658444 RepID=A0A9P9WKJ9_9PEZI|nr:hypothetical protein JX265_007043 [Neoarthrinium moseri]
MATIDLSSHRRFLLSDENLMSQLPPEILQIIRSHDPTNFLDAVAAAALVPEATSSIYVYFENVFADICARWLLKPRREGQEDRIIAAFARILPFAPSLSVFLEQYLRETSTCHGDGSRIFMVNSLDSLHAGDLVPILIAVWRLLNFDRRTYRQLVLPSQMQALFKHERLPVRYVAIRVFCLLLSASDLKLEELIREHVSVEDAPGFDYQAQRKALADAEEKGKNLDGDFDGQTLDLTFLSLFEQQRAREIEELRQELRTIPDVPAASFPLQLLTPRVIRYGTTLLPRPHGPPTSSSALVHTSTTLVNLEALSRSLQMSGPILLHGLPGSGKTSVVHELARELGMDSGMVTLHLNEQTDAKMLIGLYSTDSKPGSFSWRPGVLTTAVREGRWVLIEDLDRAPNEVMSTLLPLVERGELLIPSRGEKIVAPSSFRLFATVRTSRGMHGQENLPTLLGQRFWHSVPTRMAPPTELQEIILGTYPLLHKFIPDIIPVYNRLCSLPSRSAGAGRGIADRPVTPRDLLKWCRRLHELLIASGCKTGDEPISETTRDWMFLEAVDCFCGSVPNMEAKAALVSSIAQQMHLPPQRVDHYIQAYVPQLEEAPSSLRVGRTVLGRKMRGNRVTKSKKPFASTSHAKRLLEQIAVAVKLREPTLLVGETGIGKTTVVQQLAESLGHKLVAVNLSQQSEVSDLLGGFKPVNVRTLAVPLKEEFEDLFASTGISAAKNQKYLDSIGKCIAKAQWTRVSKLWREAPKMFNKIVEELQRQARTANGDDSGDRPPVKRRKTESRLLSLLDLRPRWDAFDRSLDQFDVQISGGSGSFAFAFVEGNIVKAARNGDWVLLDEINLASPDTLESIADLLASGPNDEPSILLSETGEIERVKAHPEFRIFGAMNPATDIGKRDLPIGLRSRFTELYVSSPDKDLKDLLTIIKAYLQGNTAKDEQAADDIARLYLKTKELADQKRLVDGANEVPHFSLRTLTRVLSYVNDISPFYGLRRSLYEGFSMGFLTLLSKASEDILVPEIRRHLLEKRGSAKSILSQPPKHPSDGKQYVRFQNEDKDRHYWLLQGVETPRKNEDYVITKSVERNLLNLVRATSTRRFPVLIQGPTSAGKTSMIEYLANFSGNKFVRINNHEHTDLQEYLGTYVSGSDGKLRFQEGILVQALREGHWIVLDELNLAPTDVLEALNRLLDDNRELLIPETQEVVRPHENFMLFATQNPPGLYGGRKVLSRAFRNRFLELHFDDIPENELQTILQNRSKFTAPSDCKRIVDVYKELARLRQSSRLFENKDSFATLRDLFRWALRGAETRVLTLPGASPREEIANQGFMLLAERVRNEEERIAVKQVIETVFKVKIDPDQLYDAQKSPYLTQMKSQENAQGVVWNSAMRRLYVLVAQAMANNEPVLLVGETGCGKTTVCQLLAEALGKELHIVNAHQNTETGDLIGSQRPVRNRGAVMETLQQDLAKAFASLGQAIEGEADQLLQRYHQLDSSQLALVPHDLQQRISANEVKSKALFEWADGSLVHAMRNGQFFLLDEISLADDSVLERLNSVLEPSRTLLLAEKGIDNSFVRADDSFKFFATMNPGGDFGKKELSPALRNRFTEIWVPPLSGTEDILQIIWSKLRSEFHACAPAIVDFSFWHISPAAAVIHGAATVFIDTLGANPSALIALDPKSMDSQRQQCLDKLSQLLKADATSIYRAPLELVVNPQELRIGDFAVARAATDDFEAGFALHAPTTKLNAMRVIRALQVQKPILLEGSPGVGKTTLVSALARACGQPLTRINLSDQTDLMDLFGTDVPVEGAGAGNFAWRDAPFLRAMQNGEWVLLDEMNLASQSVLEGLNACLDHRGEVYISELDQTFKRHPNFRLFAAQNPHHQGGGRKGLPSSFVNRFIVVYADVFTEEDLLLIAQHNFPAVPLDTVKNLISFISKLDDQVVVERSFGTQGSPWEFNLRDTLRWLQLLTSGDPLLSTGKVDDFLDIVIRQRFRNAGDRKHVDRIFAEAFQSAPKEHQLFHSKSSQVAEVGLAMIQREKLVQPSKFPCISEVVRLTEIESLLICIKQNLPCILAGPSGSGKSALLQHVAALCGKELITFPMNADIDTMDLVGGFEQRDPLREVNVALRELQEALQVSVLSLLPQAAPEAAVDLLNHLENISDQTDKPSQLLGKIQKLQAQISSDSQLAKLLDRSQSLLSRSNGIRDPTFEWLDGIIVQALQKGQWLVLDNANLCNASVLDRLNSLLEPNGFLIINEHCGPNGEPRIITPHPNFRIFLTMDPRYGELSRAMRNRGIEIHIDFHESSRPSYLQRMAQVEPSLARYEMLGAAALDDANKSTQFAYLAAENLGRSDLSNLVRYSSHTRRKLIKRKLWDSLDRTEKTRQAALDQLLQFTQTTSNTPGKILAAIHEMSSTLTSAALPGLGDVQPFHPLQNTTILPLLLGYNTGLPGWVATCYETYMGVAKARSALHGQATSSNGRNPSDCNRLQRSCMANRAPAVSKDSTVGAAKFLEGSLDAIETYICAQLTSASNWKERRFLINGLMHFWWRTYRLLTNDETLGKYNEARFQAHLGQGGEVLMSFLSGAKDDTARELAAYLLTGLEESFIAGFRLTTGLSMEALWHAYRPVPITTASIGQRADALEFYAPQFDNVKWHKGASIADIGNLVASLSNTYRLLRDDIPNADEIIQTYRAEMEKLSTAEARDAGARPNMSAEFEVLRQAIVLEASATRKSLADIITDDLVVLSDLPMKAHLRLQTATSTCQPLQSVAYLMGAHALRQSDNLDEHSKPVDHPWTKSISASIVSKLESVNSIDLKSLHMLEAELPILARQVAVSSEAITDDTLDKLADVLRLLMQDVVQTLGPEYASAFREVQLELLKTLESSSLSISESGLLYGMSALQHFALHGQPHLTTLTSDHLIPAMVSLSAANKEIEPRRTYLANAWTQFGLYLVKLYIPDKMFDPQLKPQMVAQSHEERLQQLNEQLKSLQQFANFFTGQSTSLRSDLVQEEVVHVGATPEFPVAVYRDTHSTKLQDLQGHFNSLLKTVLGADITSVFFQHCFGSELATQQLQLIRQNISLVVYRMGAYSDPSAYEDLRVPAINIIHCLEVGLSLAEVASAQRVNTHSSNTLLNIVPFIGAGTGHNLKKQIDIDGFELMSYFSNVVSVEGIASLNASMRRTLSQTIHSFYDQWSQKLEADRKAEEQRKSMYRYRGGFDEQEAAEKEEFDQLFPSYDDQEAEAIGLHKPQIQDARTFAIKLAEVHRSIFLAPHDASGSIRAFCKLAIRKISKNTKEWVPDGTLLPATLLVLDEKLAELTATTTSPNYNFYADSNLPEVRKLVKLVNETRIRFRQLQQVDEIGHMVPLQDVINACDKVMELPHSEPLAKIITVVEKLHGFVYEWQFGGWASKVYAVLPLYNRLTDMLVSWRRLELSTWGRLFDMEFKKSQDDANSWWFVAYQAVVAGPMALAQSDEDLHAHAANLLKELETYFSSATVGQFVTRLDLMRQLHKQLELLVLDWPSISVIRDAVQNFIGFYAHFEKAAQESLQRGRTPIEKQMKDVLLFASWKDTNIAALRESARKSHLKLFRLIKKFRDVLGQPMKTIIDQGLPDETHSDNPPNQAQNVVSVNAAALAQCEQNVSGWSTEYKRLANVQRTVDIMVKMGSIPASGVDAVDSISSFLTSLHTLSAELRKETPGTLTEENKNLVKHLKSRKRKLYAETFKAVREMGFNYNLGTDALEKQDSLAAVLSRSSPIISELVPANSASEYYFHKILDLAPRFRNAAHDHNEDLTAAEVGRSIGFLEGMLQIIINQRQTLSATLLTTESLTVKVQQAQTLAAATHGEIHAREKRKSNAPKASAWIVPILEVAAQLIAIHGKFGAIDNSSILSSLSEWRHKLSSIPGRFATSGTLPRGLVSADRLKAETEFARLIQDLDADLQIQSESRPDLAFILDKIQLWTLFDEQEVPLSVSGKDNQTKLLNAIKKLCDSILVAVEQFNKSMANLPTSSEESGWLMKYDETLMTATKALHMDKIIKTLEHALSSFVEVNLEDVEINSLASSLMAVTCPIIEQYHIICRSHVLSYAHLNHSTSKMAHTLSKSFVQLAGQGFCTPQEKSDEESGDSGKLESGTGLGEGEGADDISKDIQPDEDLSELAQEKNKESKDGEELEDEKDAVDMADEDLEGEVGSVAGEDDDEKGSKSGDEEDEENDMDEETGDVDDLDPDAVDEKMWDGDNEEEAEKDQQGDKSKGQQKKDEQMAADQKPDDKDAQPEEDGEQQGDEDENEDLGAEQDEDVQFDEMNHQDQNVQEQETLALPDDMDIDGNDDDDMSSISDDDLDKLSDVEEQDTNEQGELSDKESEHGDDADMNVPADEEKEDAETEEQQDEENANIKENEEVDQDRDQDDEAEDREKADNAPMNDESNADNVAPSDAQNGGQDQDANQTEDQDQDGSQDNSAQRESGEMGESAADQETSSGNKGSVSQAQEQPAQSEMEDARDSAIEQPFKALGDALEKFYRQQREIKESRKDPAEQQQQQQPMPDMNEQEMASREFQHLQDDETAADTQAIGTATEEESRPFDDTMAIDDETQAQDSRVQQPDEEQAGQDEDSADKMDTSEPLESSTKQEPQTDEPRTGVSTRQGAYDREDTPPMDGAVELEEDDDEEDVEEASVQLESTHLSGPAQDLRDFDESMQQWTTFQTKTNPLSLSLTSQLRLILTPSQSTKLSGSYRTGKRLNIKRIIPYIASSYKRDKIWMRRAIPTKRSYQILLCVDDSKSMGESSSGTLALESLVMVSRALTMLEVGQVGVLGFGANTFMAHEFAEPFASHDAGAKVLQKFSFNQDHTDIRQLVRDTISRFRTARLQNPGRGSEDLWQLALVLSDGLTPSAEHEDIRRLLREAHEERIMVVFIVMDDTASKKRDSVLNLRTVQFVKDALGNTTGEISWEYYLDSFPFQYYLIVHNLEDLPGALAGLLRSWFAEVNA